jgi:hypothetical protein
MTLGTDRKVVEDTGSEIVRLTRLELNKVLDAVDGLVAASQLADFAAFKAAAAAIDTTDLRKLVASVERPAAPANPTY